MKQGFEICLMLSLFQICVLGIRSQDASPSVEMNTPLNTPLPSLNQSEQNSMRGSTLSLMTRYAFPCVKLTFVLFNDSFPL